RLSALKHALARAGSCLRPRATLGSSLCAARARRTFRPPAGNLTSAPSPNRQSPAMVAVLRLRGEGSRRAFPSLDLAGDRGPVHRQLPGRAGDAGAGAALDPDRPVGVRPLRSPARCRRPGAAGKLAGAARPLPALPAGHRRLLPGDRAGSPGNRAVVGLARHGLAAVAELRPWLAAAGPRGDRLALLPAT